MGSPIAAHPRDTDSVFSVHLRFVSPALVPRPCIVEAICNEMRVVSANAFQRNLRSGLYEKFASSRCRMTNPSIHTISSPQLVRILTGFILQFVLLNTSSLAQPDENVSRILVMHGVWEAGPWDLNIDRGIVENLQLSEDSSVQVSFEYLGIDAEMSPQRLAEIRAHIEAMVREQGISIIVAVQPLASALFFDLDLPEGVAGLLLLPTREVIELARGHPDVTIVESAGSTAISQTIEQISLLRPEGGTVYVVGGNNGDDLLYVNYVRAVAESYQSQFQFEYLIGVEPAELERRLRQLSPNDTVLSLPFSAYTDSEGNLTAVGSVYLDLMIDSVPSPLFGIYDRLLGQGLTGGALSSTSGYANTVAELLRYRLQNGEWGTFLTPGEAFTLYDWREVQRWNLDLDRLGVDYELINQPESLWQSNPVFVLVFGNIVLILSLVVLFMGIQLRRSNAAQTAIANSERLARENEERYKLLATNTVDVIWTWNSKTEEVTYCSPSIEKLTGYTAEEFLSQPLHKWVTPESFQRCIALYNKGLSSSEQLIEVEHYKKGGGTVWCEMSAHPVIQSNDRDTWVGVTRDITQRKQEEMHRNKLEASVRQNQKFESLGTLAGGIAHDFNNVLGVMMGLIDLLAEEVKGKSSDLLIDKLDNSAQKAKRLVQRILTFARQKEGSKEVLDFNELVKETIELLESGIPPNATLQSDITPELIKISGDRTQIEQIIMNVATNAIEALGSANGTIKFSLCLQTYEQTTDLPHGSLQPGKYARLSVEDNGIGIDGNTIDRIFDPFFTSKEMGSGMGLAIVRNIIVQHGGAIDLHSEPGSGTCFEIFLPVSTAELDKPSDDESLQPLDRSLSILIIDDQSEVLETASLMLEKMGHECLLASDPIIAMERIAANHDTLDLVITDYSMPKMNGLEIVERCARDYPELRVLLSTGYGDALPQNTVLANNRKLIVLHKPYSYKDLQQMVEITVFEADPV